MVVSVDAPLIRARRPAESMGFHPLIDTNRISLLVCDGCDALMTLNGDKAAKRHSESDPEDRAPHYGTAADLRATATAAGWTKDGDAWMCASCSRPPAAT
jgi:hypothetical protein